MKDVTHRRDDDDRENGTNGDDRKGRKINLPRYDVSTAKYYQFAAANSPVPAHDELDTAE